MTWHVCNNLEIFVCLFPYILCHISEYVIKKLTNNILAHILPVFFTSPGFAYAVALLPFKLFWITFHLLFGLLFKTPLLSALSFFFLLCELKMDFSWHCLDHNFLMSLFPTSFVPYVLYPFWL